MKKALPVGIEIQIKRNMKINLCIHCKNNECRGYV